MARGRSSGSQTTKATLRLRELVFDGELAPGDRLPEVELSERVGVSRTPLRIALTTLAHEGLLEQLPGGGFAVRAFSRADVTDAIELRGVLEGTAARFAAERLTSADELAPLEEAATALDEVVRNIADNDQIERYVVLNDAFHVALVELARSPHLGRAIANVNALPFATPSGAILASHAAIRRSQEILLVAQYHHWGLIEAIRERQGTRAEEIAREHARLSRRNLELLFEDDEGLERMPGGPLLSELARA